MERLVPKRDSEILNKLAKSCKDPRERERLRALYALSIGYSASSVSEIFRVDETTIYRWVERWHEERNVSDEPREGRPPVLGEKEKKQIRKLVEENDPKKYGVNASVWDCRELQIYFQMKGLCVSRDTIRRNLKGMGAVYVKAHHVFPEADWKKRKDFAKKFSKEMASKPDSVVVLFQDEMSANCSPKKGYGWTFKKRLVVKAPQKRRRVNCFGAVNPLKGEVIQMSTGEAKTCSFIKFLKKIKMKYPRKKIWVYLDNLKVHKSRKVEEFLDKDPTMELKFMPAYSPDLNPVEEMWNFQRRKFLNNKSFRSRHQLATALHAFVRKIPSEQVRSVCSLTHLQNLALA